MTNIADKSIVLKLNRNWVRVGVGTVGDTICDLMTGVVTAVDITYPFNDDGSPNFTTYDYIKPVKWEEWVQLPVRPWDLSIKSTKIKIRVPTVVITTKYAKIPEKKFKGKPFEAAGIPDYRNDGRQAWLAQARHPPRWRRRFSPEF